MSKFLVIGMTGPTGSGKSTIGETLCARGFKIVDADKVARRVTEKGSPTLAQLCSAFGDDIMYPCGELDRAALAKKAFADEESLRMLNSITHPAIIELIKAEIEVLRASGETKIILDAPQLFEAGADKLCDYVISVLADRATRLERIMERDNITEEQALSRINAQKSDDFFVENSDFVIYNNSDIEALTPQIDLLIEKTLEVGSVNADFEKSQPTSAEPEKTEQKSTETPKKKIGLIAAIAAVVVAAIVVLIICLTGGSYTDVIDKSYALYKTPNQETIEQIYPEQMWDFLLNERYSVIDPSVETTQDIIERYILDEMKNVSNKKNSDFGEGWTLDCDIISEKKLSSEEVEQISADIESGTGRDMRVRKAYTIHLAYTLSGSKQTTENFMSFTAVKIGSDWYVAEKFPEIGWKIIVLEF
ncbi:MAG: dephospho-CoA kinase [Clostridia bacterium]|nr:dephospho-CoA kinase [Clostridia bacterium]